MTAARAPAPSRVALPAGASAIAAALAAAALLTAEWRSPAYAMPAWIVAVAWVAAALVTAGAVQTIRHRDVAGPWFAVLIALLVAFGLYAIFSIGLALLVLAMGLPLIRSRIRRRRGSPHATPRHRAGLLLALGMTPLALLAVQPPVVTCSATGGGESLPVWLWIGAAGPASGSVSGGPSAAGGPTTLTGSFTAGGTTYTFVCAGARLVRLTHRG